MHYITKQPVIAMPVDGALLSAMEKRWSWLQGLGATPKPVQSISNCDTFEKFIGAGLHHLFTRLLHWVDPRLEPGPAVSAAQSAMQSEHAKGNTVLSDGRKVDAVVPDTGILH